MNTIMGSAPDSNWVQDLAGHGLDTAQHARSSTGYEEAGNH